MRRLASFRPTGRVNIKGNDRLVVVVDFEKSIVWIAMLQLFHIDPVVVLVPVHLDEVRPIRTKRDHEAGLKEIERLWGAKAGTRVGDRLDVLATHVDAYEGEYHPMDPRDPNEAIKFRMEQQGSSGGIWRRSLAHVPASPRS